MYKTLQDFCLYNFPILGLHSSTAAFGMDIFENSLLSYFPCTGSVVVLHSALSKLNIFEQPLV